MAFQKSILGAAALCAAGAASWAQAPASLAPVVVTGNPLGSDSVIAPVDVLSGEALQSRRASTLGDTLNGLPGVSASGFGPNASRPIIRGMDGDRVRIL
ncbi:MAG: hypothetical protein RLZZ271_551, partial [Pseudomonadota bacterium]